MSSTSDVLARSNPRVRLAPRFVQNDVDDAAFLSSGYGLTPDDWQEDVLEDWLGRRRDGRWSASTCGLAVPRQNGKNGIIEMRELFGMVVLGEKVLHTAHEVKTARKAFLRIASFFENERQYPELARLVASIRKTNGQEAVILTNGASVEFIARSKGSGRGFTVDVLVCDEAQDLSDEHLSALLPTLSAAPLGNPQLILTGTPPDPEKGQLGEVFARIRADAVAKRNKRLAWIDYGVPDGRLPDIDNRATWAAVNPALGIRLSADWIRDAEWAVMSPETFARERLGWWGDPSAASSTAFGEGRWQACQVEGLEQPAVEAVGAAVAFGQMSASIGIAGKVGDLMVVGAMDHRDGAGWIIPKLASIQAEHNCMVVVDGGGPTADLIPAMEAAGITLTITKTGDVKDACAGIFNRVQDKTLAHGGHPYLDQAVAAASKREVGDRWAWARKASAGDISMLEAVTLAAWAASTNAYDVMESAW